MGEGYMELREIIKLNNALGNPTIIDGLYYYIPGCGKVVVRGMDKHIRKAKILKGTEIIVDGAFYNYVDLHEVDIPEGVTEIGGSAFYNSSIKDIKIPDTVTYIGTNAFKGCGSLENCKLSTKLEKLSESVFMDCSKLKRLELPQLKEIGPWACAFCSSLETIEIPDSVESISEYAFTYCNNLKYVILPIRLYKYRKTAFDKIKIKYRW